MATRAGGFAGGPLWPAGAADRKAWRRGEASFVRVASPGAASPEGSEAAPPAGLAGDMASSGGTVISSGRR